MPTIIHDTMVPHVTFDEYVNIFWDREDFEIPHWYLYSRSYQMGYSDGYILKGASGTAPFNYWLGYDLGSQSAWIAEQ